MGVAFEDSNDVNSGWMYPKDSILQTLFDNYMLELIQSGVAEQISQTFFKKQVCPASQELTEIGIDFVKSIFVILSCGIMTSIFISIMERIIHNQNKPNQPFAY